MVVTKQASVAGLQFVANYEEGKHGAVGWSPVSRLQTRQHCLKLTVAGRCDSDALQSDCIRFGGA